MDTPTKHRHDDTTRRLSLDIPADPEPLPPTPPGLAREIEAALDASGLFASWVPRETGQPLARQNDRHAPAPWPVPAMSEAEAEGLTDFGSGVWL